MEDDGGSEMKGWMKRHWWTMCGHGDSTPQRRAQILELMYLTLKSTKKNLPAAWKATKTD
jgi:hypothetical protein